MAPNSLRLSPVALTGLFHRHGQRVVMQLNQRAQIRADFIRAFESGEARGFGFFFIRNIGAFGVMLEIAIKTDDE